MNNSLKEVAETTTINPSALSALSTAERYKAFQELPEKIRLRAIKIARTPISPSDTTGATWDLYGQVGCRFRRFQRAVTYLENAGYLNASHAFWCWAVEKAECPEDFSPEL